MLSSQPRPITTIKAPATQASFIPPARHNPGMHGMQKVGVRGLLLPSMWQLDVEDVRSHRIGARGATALRNEQRDPTACTRVGEAASRRPRCPYIGPGNQRPAYSADGPNVTFRTSGTKLLPQHPRGPFPGRDPDAGRGRGRT